MVEPSDYKEYLVYPDKWTPPVKTAPPAPPTAAQVEAFMKTLVLKPMDKQSVIQRVDEQFHCKQEVAKVLIEEIEAKWHPVKYQTIAEPKVIEE